MPVSPYPPLFGTLLAVAAVVASESRTNSLLWDVVTKDAQHGAYCADAAVHGGHLLESRQQPQASEAVWWCAFEADGAPHRRKSYMW